MKRITQKILVACFVLAINSVFAQESFNRTVNLGIGIDNYRYAGNSFPVLHLDYELSVARNFTLAPFVSFFSYSNYYKNNGIQYYYYETAIPLGVKVSYYLDQFLEVNSKWDFYVAASLGFAIIKSNYSVGYVGEKDAFNHANHMFSTLHLGAEYHFTSRIGGFIDLSNGLTTVGVAIH